MQSDSSNQTYRIPLVFNPENRNISQNIDAKIINGYAEKNDQGGYSIYKRFGFDTYHTYENEPLGMTLFQNNLVIIYGSKLYVGGSLVYSSLNTKLKYTFTSTLGSTPTLFFHNIYAAYTYTVSGGVVPIVNISPFTFTANITNTSPIITNISTTTTNMRVGDSITGSGIPIGSTIISIDSSTQITISIAATATTVGVTLTDTPFSLFPSDLVSGCTYLDGTVYVMDTKNNIYGSEINAPLVWNPTNVIRAQNENSSGTYITRQLSYVVAFKQFSIEFFYDAGNSVGSPLLPVQGAFIPIGCHNGPGTIQQIEGVIYFMATSPSSSYCIMALKNMSLIQVSTPPIERLLLNIFSTAELETLTSFSFRFKGHVFYGLFSTVIGYALVYDITENLWYKWKFFESSEIAPLGQSIAFSSFGVESAMFFQMRGSSILYTISLDDYTDGSTVSDRFPINFELYTPNFEAGTKKRKILHSLEIIGDQQDGSIVEIRNSDDDYQTWTNFRKVDISKQRPRLISCGTFRKRAYHLKHTSNTPLRIEAIEVIVEKGEL